MAPEIVADVVAQVATVAPEVVAEVIAQVAEAAPEVMAQVVAQVIQAAPDLVDEVTEAVAEADLPPEVLEEVANVINDPSTAGLGGDDLPSAASPG